MSTINNEPLAAAEQLTEVQEKSFFEKLTEDGWAICIGAVLITAVLLFAFVNNGFKFSVPTYQWENSADLFGKVYSGKNLLLISGIGLLFAAISSIAIYLSGANA